MVDLMRPDHGGRGVAGDDRRHPDRPAGQEGNHRRDHRRGAGDARVRRQGADVARRAALGRYRRHRRRRRAHLQHFHGRRCSSRRPPARRSPSTATAACRPSPAAPMCSRRSAPTSSCTPEQVAPCIEQDRHRFHVRPEPSSGHDVTWPPVRREMGVRTIFNILGPLTNPAGAPNMLMGVFHPDLVGIQVARAAAPWRRTRLGGVRPRRSGRNFARRGDPGRRAARRTDHASTKSIPRISASPWPRPAICAWKTPSSLRRC